MRRLARATGLLIAALSLGGCQYAFPLDLVQRDGKLLIWTEREWKWFLIPERPRLAVDCIEVWSGRRWMWQVEAPQGGEIVLPIAYGEVRPGMTVRQPPQKLLPGSGYVARTDEANGKRFRISAVGKLVHVEDAGWTMSPDERTEEEARTRGVAALRARGLTEMQAYTAWHRQHGLGQKGSRCVRSIS